MWSETFLMPILGSIRCFVRKNIFRTGRLRHLALLESWGCVNYAIADPVVAYVHRRTRTHTQLLIICYPDDFTDTDCHLLGRNIYLLFWRMTPEKTRISVALWKSNSEKTKHGQMLGREKYFARNTTSSQYVYLCLFPQIGVDRTENDPHNVSMNWGCPKQELHP